MKHNQNGIPIPQNTDLCAPIAPHLFGLLVAPL